MLQVGETRNTTKTRAVSYRCWERACVRQGKASARARLGACGGEGGRSPGVGHSQLHDVHLSPLARGAHGFLPFPFSFFVTFRLFRRTRPEQTGGRESRWPRPTAATKEWESRTARVALSGPGRSVSRLCISCWAPRVALLLPRVGQGGSRLFFGGGGGANCIYCAKIRKNQVTLAEWSKAVRSGRIHLLMAWVRIPQVTT